MKKLVKLLLFLVILVGLSVPVQAKTLTIAMIPKSLITRFFLMPKPEAKPPPGVGCQLHLTGSTTADAASQVSVIEGLIQRKVDGMVISCGRRRPEERDRPGGCRWDQGGHLRFGLPGQQAELHCGTDNYKAGLACGEMMVKLLKEAKKISRPYPARS